MTRRTCKGPTTSNAFRRMPSGCRHVQVANAFRPAARVPRRASVWSKKSCGLPVVVLQEAAQSLLAAHFAIAGTHPLFSCWKKQNIFFALMVSLSTVVLDERRYRSPQGRLAEQNQLRQAFLMRTGNLDD